MGHATGTGGRSRFPRSRTCSAGRPGHWISGSRRTRTPSRVREHGPIRGVARLLTMLRFGVVALGVSDVRRAADFWSAALGYELRENGFGGWAKVLMPPNGAGPAIALQLSQTPAQDHPRLHLD